MNMNYTSVEQSKKLIKLGLDPETADAVHNTSLEFSWLRTDDSEIKKKEFLVPCWSVAGLLRVLPSHKDCTVMFSTGDVKNWKCVCTTSIPEEKVLCETSGDDMLITVYDMVVWLLKNDYIK